MRPLITRWNHLEHLILIVLCVGPRDLASGRGGGAINVARDEEVKVIVLICGEGYYVTSYS